jgi:hypothetical protein
MKKNFISKFFSFFAGVVDTADKHSFVNISVNFRKNLKWSSWEMQLLSGAEHFGNVVNVTWIIVEMLNRCMNKRWSPNTGLWYNVWARGGEVGLARQSLEYLTSLIILLHTSQCAMKYIYLGPSFNLLFGLFFWTLPDKHPPFPRCHKVDLYFTQ